MIRALIVLALVVVVLVITYVLKKVRAPEVLVSWKSPWNERRTWAVNRSNQLLMEGRTCDPSDPIGMEFLTRHVLAMESQIEEANKTAELPSRLVTICVDDYVAAGLWNEGSLTREHLVHAKGGRNGVELPFAVAGKVYDLRVGASYYDTYSFWVERDNGEGRWVRDNPDLLELVHTNKLPEGYLDEDSDVRTAFDTVKSPDELAS